ncbi:hypothetical protein GCM10023217_03910 [Gordonia alkaliphila]|uniref:UbiC transcription regulator-associated domain-containing protein n=2 Tax=Gordonia alkaliphila TaxID=1053547 RepID=A0ABP8YTP6_9ACTN
MEFDPDAGSLNHFLLATGVDLDSARHRVDAVAADVEDAEQLGVPVGSPLLRACQITADSTSRILESADVRYVPGHILDAVADLPALVAPASAVALA